MHCQIHMQDQISNRVEEIMSWHWKHVSKPERFQGLSVLIGLPLLLTLWHYI